MSMFAMLASIVGALDRAGIVHMVSGSVASARHGEARATQDIDLVIDPTPGQMQVLLNELSATHMYIGDGATALQHRTQFNVIDTASGWKVDLIIRRERPFSIVELERRRPVVLGGVECWIASPEDCILSKLEWAATSGSERQLRDVRSLLAVQRGMLDDEYLDRWAPELGVAGQLADLRREVDT